MGHVACSFGSTLLATDTLDALLAASGFIICDAWYVVLPDADRADTGGTSQVDSLDDAPVCTAILVREWQLAP